MDWQVMAVEPTKNYKLILTFKSGEKRIFDFLPMLDHKINNPLKMSGSL